MSADFSVPVIVRGYETDTQGHLNQSVYLQYAEHARWSIMQAAGIRQAEMVQKRIGPVALDTTIRFRRELVAGDEVDVTCVFEWTDGKIFRIKQTITKTDGTLAAEVEATGGIMDLTARKLLPDAGAALRELATSPEVIGL